MSERTPEDEAIDRELERALSPTYTRPEIDPKLLTRDTRVVHRDTDKARQSYAFTGTTSRLKPYVLRPPGTDPNVPPEYVGVLIPYAPDTTEGYLVWVDPAELALDTRT